MRSFRRAATTNLIIGVAVVIACCAPGSIALLREAPLDSYPSAPPAVTQVRISQLLSRYTDVNDQAERSRSSGYKLSGLGWTVERVDAVVEGEGVYGVTVFSVGLPFPALEGALSRSPSNREIEVAKRGIRTSNGFIPLAPSIGLESFVSFLTWILLTYMGYRVFTGIKRR